MTTHCIQTCWNSPLGELRIVFTQKANAPARCTAPAQCTGLYFQEHHPLPRHWRAEAETVAWDSEPASRHIVEQLEAYFTDSSHRFDVNCRLVGTDFQNQVWQQLLTIPAGQRRSYREIAVAIGRPAATRAVGAAIGRNPISILLPCHRVVPTGGGLGGFAGGLDRKRWLLEHESSLRPLVLADPFLQPMAC